MEVLCAVVDILASPKSGALVPLDRSSHFPMALLKPPFRNLRALSCVSRKMRLTVLAAWYRTLYIRDPEDWDLAVRMQICGHVLEVRVLAAALDMKRPFSTTILARFPRLHTVFIDAHNDIVPRSLVKDDPTFRKLLAAHPSRKYFSMLPRLIWPDTLRRLWITNTHFDTQLIPNISSMCPNLEDLWISRCTIFSRNVSGPERLCNFWDGDVTRHEQYFFLEPRTKASWEQIMEHPMPNLRKLHLGSYNIPGSPLIPHLVIHKRIAPNLNLPNAHDTIWRDVCPLCTHEHGLRELKIGATMCRGFLKSMPHLEEVSWPLFCSIHKVWPAVWTPDNVLRLPKDVLNRLPSPKPIRGAHAPRMVGY
ncbi:hypothetical protein FS749_014457 [Ceratobasidium sp. UAMH 11750]|nr:hypothetical protein FS749_014457 [Ceratobasidium sp. UAMH 11750]